MDVAQPSPVVYRSFNDIVTQRKRLRKYLLDALQGVKVVHSDYEVELVDPDYDDDPDDDSDRDDYDYIKEARDALLNNKDLGKTLYGTLRLKNVRTGEVLDERRIALAAVPVFDPRGAIIRRGVSYVIRSQSRLKPGAYTRVTQDGEYETHFNIKPGTGRGFRVVLDPSNGVFSLKTDSGSYPLVGILKAAGVDDYHIRDAIGEELYRVNVQAIEKSDPVRLHKVLSRIAHKATVEGETDFSVRDILQQMKIDPGVSERTLGQAFDSVTPEALLLAMRKQLMLAQEHAAPDNRDSMEFQALYMPEDLLAERFQRQAPLLLRKIAFKAAKDGSLRKVHGGIFNDVIDSFLHTSGTGLVVEGVNPVEFYDLRQAITRLGEGGISSNEAVSREARNVQSSYLGVIDPSRAPECYDDATEVFTAGGWVPWKEVTPQTLFLCMVNGECQFLPPIQLHKSLYQGVMYAYSGDVEFCVTGNHRLYGLCDHPYGVFVQADELYYDSVNNNNAMPWYIPTRCRLPDGKDDSQYWSHFTAELTALTALGLISWSDDLSTVYCYHISPPPSEIVHFQGDVVDVSAELSEDVRRYFASMSFSRLLKSPRLWRQSVVEILKSYMAQCTADQISSHMNVSFHVYALSDGAHGFVSSHRHPYYLWYIHKQMKQKHIELCELLFSDAGYSVQYIQKMACLIIAKGSFAGFHPSVMRKQYYNGFVYCATVPGGLVYVRRNGSRGFWCGNSENIGVDLRATDAATVGTDHRLYTKARNLRTGEIEHVPVDVLAKSVVAFPGALANASAKRIPAIKNDRIVYVNRDEAEYEIPSADYLLSRATRLIPMPEGVKSQRLLMGGRMLSQALPLIDPDSPYVQSGDSETKESLYVQFGDFAGVRRSPVDGTVIDITEREVKIRGDDGRTYTVSLFYYFPIGRKTHLHNYTVWNGAPLITKGGRVKAGQIIARSNYTDKDGALALGKNLRIAYMVAEGDTIEDAFVISESAAKKLGAQFLYKAEFENDDLVHSMEKSVYLTMYPDRFNEEQMQKIGEDGIVKPGTVVNFGDPLILSVKRKPLSFASEIAKLKSWDAFSDGAITWDHSLPGIVTDVVRTKHGIKVYVASQDVARSGDKLSLRYGNKGVISSIRPDSEMPIAEDGKPVDIIINANGVISRINPSSLAEALLGKIVERARGEPYVIPPFSTSEGLAEFAVREAEKYGISETETLTDPRTGRKIPNVFVGNGYVMRLHHISEGKLSARSQAGYTVDDLPAKGGPTGSKRIGLLDTNVLVAAGATEFLRDAKLARGQRNDDYWRALRMGELTDIPMRYLPDEQFKAYLRGAGINIREEDTREQLLPMLDRDVKMLAPHAIENAETFDFETLTPVSGGLFDLATTGGAYGNRYTRIDLPAKIPHPLFVDPISRLLGITKKDMFAILYGQKTLNGKTGPEAIESALQSLPPLDDIVSQLKQKVKMTRGHTRDEAIRTLQYVFGLKKMNVNPEELMISSIPVIPPRYRPIIRFGDMDMIHDLNYLYKDIFEAAQNYKEAKQLLGETGDDYKNLYEAVEALIGFRDPVNPKTAEQGVRGILQFAIGTKSTPKMSMYQRKVIGSVVDTVGRGVITADRSLRLDEIGVPEPMAWEIFKPFVIRRMVREGYDPKTAIIEVRNQTPTARKYLLDEARERPVVYNRAPALHRYAYQGAFAKIVPGHAIRLPYYTLKAIGGDYDGDTINVHVPSSPEAVEEVKNKLLPSKNLFFAGSFETHYEPVQDYVLGLYLASKKDSKQPVRRFKTLEEARQAYVRGEISLRTPIIIETA